MMANRIFKGDWWSASAISPAGPPNARSPSLSAKSKALATKRKFLASNHILCNLATTSAQELGIMTKSTHDTHCPKCGAPISEEAPGGLCPKCVLGGAATVSSSSAPGRRTPPPTREEISLHFPDLEIIEPNGEEFEAGLGCFE